MSIHNEIRAWGVKVLSKVDLPHLGSHQHEIGTPHKKYKHVFGNEGQRLLANIHFGHNLNRKFNTLKDIELVYYDTRQKNPERSSEFRLYYPNHIDDKFSRYKNGDLCFFIKTVEHYYHLIFVPAAHNAQEIIETYLSGQSIKEDDMLNQLLGFSKKFQIHYLVNFEIEKQEQLGTKEKRWHLRPESKNIPYLFKLPRTGKGESWGEMLAFQIASRLDIEAAPVEFCQRDSSEPIGIISRTFIDNRISRNKQKEIDYDEKTPKEFAATTLLHGNEILHRHLGTAYDLKTLGRKQKLYTIENCIRALQNIENFPESEWRKLLQYFIYDCLIGNTDRHHENWGIIELNIKSDEKFYRLAPTYDHGPALGALQSRDEKLKILNNNEMERFYHKGPPRFHDRKGHRIRFRGIIEECIELEQKFCGEPVHSMELINKIAGLDENLLPGLLAKIPDSIMNEIDREFALKYFNFAREFISSYA